MPGDAPPADHVLMPFSPEQRMGALEQDMAAMKKAVTTLESESALTRERFHHDSNITQRLLLQAEKFSEAITKIEISIAAMLGSFKTQGETLDTHIEECARLTGVADGNRRNFRKEMRGYFVTVILFVIGYIVTQKFHISIAPVGTP